MATRAQSLQGICYIAWDTNANAGKTGDVANHTLRLVRDGIEYNPTFAPVEVDQTNCPGLYKIDLSAAEMDVKSLTLAGKSSTAGISIVPVQITTSAAIAAAAGVPLVLNSGTQIWNDLQINQWASDGLGQIAQDVQCIWQRESIAVQAGISVITLPNYLRTLRRVTWRGRTLDCLNWEELQAVTPATIFVSTNNSANIESVSKPLYYAMHPTNIWDIRLYPCPNETFAAGSVDPYSPQPNESGCCIDYYRQPDSINPIYNLPSYIVRRTVKAYVLWKAYFAEGLGQDLKAASYYKSKFNFLVEQFRSINEGCFVGKKYSIDDGMLSVDGFRYPRPMLPPSFERVKF